MMRVLLLAPVAAVVLAWPAYGGYVGELAFTPPGCRTAGECELVHDFGYIDPKGIGWQAKAGLKTDGASIPPWAQPIVGGAWEEQFLRAAVIHDHYCKRTVRARTATHRMFYDALIESGVTRAKALVMYYAVMVGSRMWISLMEGQPCSGVANCIQNVNASREIPDAAIRKNEAGDLQAVRPARFDDPKVRQDIAAAQTIIEAGSLETPEDVEQLARTRNPTDFFLTHGDSIRYQGPTSKLPIR